MTTTTPAVPIKPKRFFGLTARTWRRLTLRVLATSAVTIAGLALYSWHLRQIIISPETTHLVAPLSPNGQPDYVQAVADLYSAGVTPDNNAALVLLPMLDNGFGPAYAQALGTTYTELKLANTDDLKTAWCRRLQLSQLDLTDEQKDQYEQMESTITQRPWRTEEFPAAGDWFETHRPAFDILRQASTQSRYYVPHFLAGIPETGVIPQPFIRTHSVVSRYLPAFPDRVSLFDTNHDHTCLTMAYKDALIARINLSLGVNRFEDACADLSTMLRLGRLYQQSDRMITNISGHSLESAGYRLLATFTQAPLSATQATALETLIQTLPPALANPVHLQQTQRWEMLELVCNLANRHATEARWDQPWALACYKPVNYNHILRVTNQYYDAIALADQLPTFVQRRDRMRALETQFQSQYLDHTIPTFNDYLLRGTLDATTYRTLAMPLNTLARQRMALIALQLHRYQLDKGKYPDQLDALKLSAETRTDPFNNQPLIYRPQPGGYLLYSVGWDGLDNGGQEIASRTKPDIDLVIRVPH